MTGMRTISSVRRNRGASAAAAALALLGALAGCRRAESAERRVVIPGADAERGRVLAEHYGCTACHIIPGVEGPGGTVGPPLIVWSRRVYIAGEVPNTPEYLIRWLENPQAIEPKTDMPMLGVSPRDARDIAEYLYTIR